MAKRTGAQCVSLVELAGWIGEQGIENVADPNFGGTVRYDWGWIKFVPAWHTNTLPDGTVIGNPAGMLINIGGKTIYHAGDTCLFGDMKLIAERNPVDIACCRSAATTRWIATTPWSPPSSSAPTP